jgi:OFA family oxalate/formate antiporter-like MFS transporter
MLDRDINQTTSTSLMNDKKQSSSVLHEQEIPEDILPLNPYFKEDKRKGIMTVIGGVSLMLYLGSFFLWGNIDIYVLSYFHQFNPNLSLGFIFLVDLFLVGANCIGYNIGTLLLSKYRWHPKLIILIAGSTALIGVFASSFTKSLPPYLALYTLMNGLGSGTCYVVPMVCGWEYFPNKKGMVNGIIIGAFGFSSFFFSLLSTKLVNPNSEAPDI